MEGWDPPHPHPNFPYGLFVDDDEQTLIIADWENHRIVQWKIG